MLEWQILNEYVISKKLVSMEKFDSIKHFWLKIYLPNMASKATTDELGVNFGVEGSKYLLGKDEGAKSNGFLNS